MGYHNPYDGYWMRKAYKEGYDDGCDGKYNNPYKSWILSGDPDRKEAYDEGYEEGKTERWR